MWRGLFTLAVACAYGMLMRFLGAEPLHVGLVGGIFGLLAWFAFPGLFQRERVGGCYEH